MDIGRGTDRFAANLFRARIIRRQQPLHRGRVVRDECVGPHEPRDAEVEQARFAVGSDQDVGRLEVAVDDELLVRVLDRVADPAQQVDALADAEPLRIAPAVDRLAVDVFHDQVRMAVRRRAAIQQARDVRMVEAGEDLPFAFETAHELARIEARAQQFQCGLLRECTVGAFAQVHRTHAAAVEHAFESPGADAQADAICLEPVADQGRDFQVRGFAQERRARRMCRDQRVHVAPQLAIAAALRVEECRARRVVGHLDHRLEQALRVLPTVRIHACGSFAACSSPYNHARACSHSRLTVAGEMSSASAVSAMVRPPK